MLYTDIWMSGDPFYEVYCIWNTSQCEGCYNMLNHGTLCAPIEIASNIIEK